MTKHLRYFFIVFFYCFLPAIIFYQGGTLYLNYLEESYIEENIQAMQRSLRGVKKEIVTQSGKSQMIRQIEQELGDLPELTSASVAEIQKKYDELYPGLIKLVVTVPKVGFGEQEWQKGFTVLGKPRFSFLYKNLSETCFVGEEIVRRRTEKKDTKTDKTTKKTEDTSAEENPLDLNIDEYIFKYSKKGISKMKSKVIGNRVVLGHFAKSSKVEFAIRHENQRATILWNFIKVSGKPMLESRRGLFFLYVFDDQYDKYFSIDKIILKENQKLDQQAISIQQIFATNEVQFNNLRKKHPSLTALQKNYLRSNLTDVSQEELIVIVPVRPQDRLTLVGVKRRLDCFPRKELWQKNLTSLVLIFLVLFIFASINIYYGYWKIYISIRTQLASLFMLASLIPLIALFYLGFQHIMTSRNEFVKEKFKEISARIHDLDVEIADYKENLSAFGIAVRDNPLSREVYKKTSEVNLPEVKNQLHQMILSYEESAVLENYFYFDLTGNTVHSMWGSRGSEIDMLRAFASNMLEYMGVAVKPDIKSGFITSMFQGLRRTIGEKLIKERGVIHKIDLLGYAVTVFMEPIGPPDLPKQIKGTFAMVFEMNSFARKMVKKIVDQNQQADIRFVAAHVKDEKYRKPNADMFGIDLQFLLERIIDEKGVHSAERMLINGEEMLAQGMILRELDDYVVIGYYPVAKINDAFRQRILFYLMIFALALLVALAIAFVISIKFIAPVRWIQKGVRAITEGDLEYRMNIQSLDELGDLSSTFNKMVAGLQEKDRMSRYVSEVVLSEVKKEGTAEFVGEEKKATILFSDIRDFTTLSETHPPTEIIRMLNDYLDVMTRVIQENGGIIDKFIGDAIMAVFYPDIPRGSRSDESRAVITALRMREELSRFNLRRREQGLFEIENGIGINTGEVIQGNIGSREYRIDLTVIGDNVNLASRLESLSKEGKYTRIILSERTWEAVEELVEVSSFGDRTVKGKTRSVALYEVKSLRKVEQYLGWLQDEASEKRVQGLRLIGVIGDQTALPAVRACLEDKEEAVRQEAAVILPRFGDHVNSSQALIKALATEPSDWVKATIIKMIGEIGTDEHRLALEPWLTDENIRVRANAIESIGSVRDKGKVIDTLREFIKDPNNRIRANACVMLWSMGETEGLEVLIKMTEQKENLMRASGAWGIGEIATREKITEMRMASVDPESLMTNEFFERMDRALERMHVMLDETDLMILRNVVRTLGKMGNRRSTHHLIKKYQVTEDDEIKSMLLTTLDEIGSYSIVRQMKDDMN